MKKRYGAIFLENEPLCIMSMLHPALCLIIPRYALKIPSVLQGMNHKSMTPTEVITRSSSLPYDGVNTLFVLNYHMISKYQYLKINLLLTGCKK